MKGKINYLLSVWWILALAVAGALLLCFAPRVSRESVSENRKLQGLPELSSESVLSGTYSTEFEAYLSDGFFGRDSLIALSKRILGVFSVASTEDLYLLDKTTEEVEAFGEESADELTETDNTQEESETENPGSVVLPSGESCYLWLDRNDGEKTAVYEYPAENVGTVASVLDEYLSLLPEDGQVFYTQVPFPKLAERWYQNPDVYCGWSSDLETALEEKTDSGVHVFSTPELLEPHIINKEAVYYRNDHHWTARGAYCVFSEMISSQGLPVTPFDEYEYKVNENRLPDGRSDVFELLYALNPTHSYVVSGITSEEEIPLMYYDAHAYHSYLASTQTPWRCIRTGFNTGKRALVICDSFGNAFTPFLLPYYDEVHMTDIRPAYFDRSELGTSVADMIERKEIDHIYFIFSEANSVNSNTQLVYLLKNLYA